MAKWQIKATRPHSASETRSSATVAKRWFHMLHFPNRSRDIEMTWTTPHRQESSEQPGAPEIPQETGEADRKAQQP